MSSGGLPVLLRSDGRQRGFSGRLSSDVLANGNTYTLKVASQGGFYVNGGDPTAASDAGYNAVLRRMLGTLAETLGRELLGKARGFPSAYHNLAIALLGQGGREKEAEELLRQAMALDPRYLHAPCTLAAMRIVEDDLDGAREILGSLDISGRIHPDEYAYFQSLLIRVAILEGKMGKATRALAVVEKVVPGHPRLDALREVLAEWGKLRKSERKKKGRG